MSLLPPSLPSLYTFTQLFTSQLYHWLPSLCSTHFLFQLNRVTNEASVSAGSGTLTVVTSTCLLILSPTPHPPTSTTTTTTSNGFYKTWIRGLCTYLQFAGLFLWVIILFLTDAALSNYTSPHLLLCYARLARLHKITKQALHNLEISISCFSFFLCFSRFSTSPSTHVSLKRTRSQCRLYRG